MSVHRTFSTALRVACWAAAACLCIALTGVGAVVISGWLASGAERASGGRHTAVERSALGDYFGGVSALFSGLALILLVVTLMFQQRELRMQRAELGLQREELVASREELRRSAEADLRSLHVQLTHLQMQDPELADIWNDYPGESPEVIRQYLFANLAYSHYLLIYRWGNVSEGEMLALARNMLQSPAFRRYWDASRGAKEALPPDSGERRLFEIFERALRDLLAPGAP